MSHMYALYMAYMYALCMPYMCLVRRGRDLLPVGERCVRDAL